MLLGMKLLDIDALGELRDPTANLHRRAEHHQQQKQANTASGVPVCCSFLSGATSHVSPKRRGRALGRNTHLFTHTSTFSMPDSPTIHVNEAVDRLSKLVLDEYVETDETIGPRVREFEQSEQQLQMLGQQITAMRDAASSQFEAHTQLIELAGITADPHLSIPSVRAYGERQEGLAALSKTLAAHYDRFVNLSVNQLEGLAGVVANKYKAYTKKVVEMRRRKAQLQLLNKQKERSDLRTLERSLIPPQGTGGPSAAFHIDLEGTLVKQSTTTRLWWSTYARLDVKKKVLLFTSRQSEPPSAASKAVALSKYVLCHELPEHHARRAAAFELVPLLPDLPVVTLAADGTMMSRKWVVALQEAIDHVEDGESDGTAVAATPSNGSGGPQTPAGETPAAGTSTPGSAVPEASPLRAIGMKLEQMVDYASKNIDELDRNFSGTLAEQSQRTQIQLAQLGEEKDVVGETVLIAIDDFSKAMASQMSEELYASHRRSSIIIAVWPHRCSSSSSR